jgi:ATP-dependent DNA ligase
VVGWTDPEGSRPWLGSLLLTYFYDPDGRLVYAGRAGTGIDHVELERLWCRLQPLATAGCRSRCPAPAALALRSSSAGCIGCARFTRSGPIRQAAMAYQLMR